MYHHVQPREGDPPRNEQTFEEIEKFLQAVDSYPDRIAKEPGISFRRHLSSLFKPSRKNADLLRRH